MKKDIWTKDYIYAILVLLCVHAGPYLLLPVITIYGKQLSKSDTLAGMMASIFAFSGLFARFLSAFLLESYPVRKVLKGFTILMALASFAYIFSSTYLQAFLLRGIQGLAYGVTCTAMSTYIVKILDHEHRLEGIGYSSLTANIANAVCPTISYALLGNNVDQFQRLFIAVFLSVAISFILLFHIKNLPTQPQTKQKKEGQIKDIFLPFLMWASMSFAMSSVSAFLSLSALDKGFTNIGLYFTLNVIGLFLSRFIMKRLTIALGEKTMIIASIALISLCLAGIALSSSAWHLYLIAIPFGFANGCLAPLINTAMLNRLPETKSGFANAAFFAAGDAGFIIGPTLWGLIASLTSYKGVFLMAAIISLLAIGIYLID